jgi:hypothetical protein
MNGNAFSVTWVGASAARLNVSTKKKTHRGGTEDAENESKKSSVISAPLW